MSGISSSTDISSLATAAALAVADTNVDDIETRVNALNTIKSIQRGQLTITNGNQTVDATISAVVMADSMVRFLGARCSEAANTNHQVGMRLDSTTTVRMERIGTTGVVTGYWELVEMNSI